MVVFLFTTFRIAGSAIGRVRANPACQRIVNHPCRLGNIPSPRPPTPFWALLRLFARPRSAHRRDETARGVILLKLDRGFRNAGDCLATVEAWDRKGIALHVIDLGGNAIDTQSAAGRFMLVVLAGAAEMERNLTRERTRSALAVKRANGQRVGTIPYGHDLADDGVTLVPNKAEQRVLADILGMRADGKTFVGIAEELTGRGVPTKAGHTTWRHTAVRSILIRQGALKRGRPAA